MLWKPKQQALLCIMGLWEEHAPLKEKHSHVVKQQTGFGELRQSR